MIAIVFSQIIGRFVNGIAVLAAAKLLLKKNSKYAPSCVFLLVVPDIVACVCAIELLLTGNAFRTLFAASFTDRFVDATLKMTKASHWEQLHRSFLRQQQVNHPSCALGRYMTVMLILKIVTPFCLPSFTLHNFVRRFAICWFFVNCGRIERNIQISFSFKHILDRFTNINFSKKIKSRY